ncbi:uroporphyrinogen-III synthase [Oceanobacillus jordanicus]|uniref:Uroporphyrinogen-III synthase n=1 Tax=Oceanobacillus jordanicus TaxID=2867266 RepID=A0AAW5BEH3_9BACI|nr:uroporphyrinogen-III synthase [Oceanobacillus jordanicus]MCG3421077.1 uroporphyrinogen-III synthase [Oceanobacillus jordanicus]
MSFSLMKKNILVTRGAEQANLFADKITQFGGNPVVVPLLEIVCKETDSTWEVLRNLSQYDWILFTSANGVDCFFELRKKLENSSSISAKIATVGEKTSSALKRYGYEETFTPETYDANTMASDFLKRFPVPGKLLLIRGNRSRKVLPEKFRQAGLDFDMLEVYDTHFSYERKPQLIEAVSKNNLDYVSFTSPSTVEAFCEMVENIPDIIPCVCIGSTTSQRARELGFQYILTPTKFTIDGMIQSISDHISKKG